MSAPGPHDFAVRADAARLTAICPSTAFRSTSTAIAIRPLLGAEQADYTPNQKFGFGVWFTRSAPSKGRIAIAVDVARNAVDGSMS